MQRNRCYKIMIYQNLEFEFTATTTCTEKIQRYNILGIY